MRILAKVFTTVSAAEQRQIDADTLFLSRCDENKADAVLEEGRVGEDLNVADDARASAVYKAARHSDVKILKYLVEGKATVDFPDRDGARPIVNAIRFDNPAAVELLLGLRNEDGTRKVELQQIVTKTGNTLLHEAAWYDRTECAKLLLDTGAFTAADLNAANKHGQTAMHVAAFRATEPFIQLLVEHGASVDRKTSNPRQIKRDSMEIALHMGKEANAKYLQDLSVALSSIRFAARMKKKAYAQRPPKPAPAAAPAKAIVAAEAPPAAVTSAVEPPKVAEPVAAAAPLPEPVLAKVPSGVQEEDIFHIRFEYDLKLFTADLEKSFLVQLAKHAGVAAEEMHVLSRTAGSVVLEIALSGEHAAAGLATLKGSSLEALSAAVGYPVLESAVKPKAAAPTNAPEAKEVSPPLSPSKALRSTPGYDPMEVVKSPSLPASPMRMRPAQ